MTYKVQYPVSLKYQKRKAENVFLDKFQPLLQLQYMYIGVFQLKNENAILSKTESQ